MSALATSGEKVSAVEMSAKVPKADIKARGELDGRAHIAVHDVGNRSSQSSLASIEFRLDVG